MPMMSIDCRIRESLFGRDRFAFMFSGKVFPTDFGFGVMQTADTENCQKEEAMAPSRS